MSGASAFRGLRQAAPCLLAVALLTHGAPAAVQRRFNVSPSGKDTNPGTSERPFRSAMGFSEALDVLRDKSGHLFDPSVVAFCVELAPSLERTLSERECFLPVELQSD